MDTHAQQPKQRRSTWVWLGAVVAMIGVAAVVGGGSLVRVHETKRDHHGFYSSRTHAVSTSTRALVSELGPGTGDEGLAAIRVTAAGTEKPVFLGIARRRQVATYLQDVSHEDITDFGRQLPTKRERHPGRVRAVPPADEHFWATQASGTGRQSIRWPMRNGKWNVVVMNADGSAGVRTRVSVGAKTALILWIGVGLLALGTAFLGGGGFSVYRGMKNAPARSTP